MDARRPYNCIVCGDELASRYRLEAHIASVHLNYLPFECILCDFVKVPTEHFFERHMDTQHPEEEKKCMYTPNRDTKRQLERLLAQSGCRFLELYDYAANDIGRTTPDSETNSQVSLTSGTGNQPEFRFSPEPSVNAIREVEGEENPADIEKRNSASASKAIEAPPIDRTLIAENLSEDSRPSGEISSQPTKDEKPENTSEQPATVIAAQNGNESKENDADRPVSPSESVKLKSRDCKTVSDDSVLSETSVLEPELREVESDAGGSKEGYVENARSSPVSKKKIPKRRKKSEVERLLTAFPEERAYGRSRRGPKRDADKSGTEPPSEKLDVDKTEKKIKPGTEPPYEKMNGEFAPETDNGGLEDESPESPGVPDVIKEYEDEDEGSGKRRGRNKRRDTMEKPPVKKSSRKGRAKSVGLNLPETDGEGTENSKMATKIRAKSTGAIKKGFNPMGCNKCDQVMTTKISAFKHTLSVHFKRHLLQCVYCLHTNAGRKHDMRKHIQTVHKKPVKMLCRATELLSEAKEIHKECFPMGPDFALESINLSWDDKLFTKGRWKEADSVVSDEPELENLGESEEWINGQSFINRVNRKPSRESKNHENEGKSVPGLSATERRVRSVSPKKTATAECQKCHKAVSAKSAANLQCHSLCSHFDKNVLQCAYCTHTNKGVKTNMVNHLRKYHSEEKIKMICRAPEFIEELRKNHKECFPTTSEFTVQRIGLTYDETVIKGTWMSEDTDGVGSLNKSSGGKTSRKRKSDAGRRQATKDTVKKRSKLDLTKEKELLLEEESESVKSETLRMREKSVPFLTADQKEDVNQPKSGEQEQEGSSLSNDGLSSVPNASSVKEISGNSLNCALCNILVVSTESMRLRHVYGHHMGKILLTCGYCNYNNSGLMRNMKVHITQKHKGDIENFHDHRQKFIPEIRTAHWRCFPSAPDLRREIFFRDLSSDARYKLVEKEQKESNQRWSASAKVSNKESEVHFPAESRSEQSPSKPVLRARKTFVNRVSTGQSGSTPSVEGAELELPDIRRRSGRKKSSPGEASSTEESVRPIEFSEGQRSLQQGLEEEEPSEDASSDPQRGPPPPDLVADGLKHYTENMETEQTDDRNFLHESTAVDGPEKSVERHEAETGSSITGPEERERLIAEIFGEDQDESEEIAYGDSREAALTTAEQETSVEAKTGIESVSPGGASVAESQNEQHTGLVSQGRISEASAVGIERNMQNAGKGRKETKGRTSPKKRRNLAEKLSEDEKRKVQQDAAAKRQRIPPPDLSDIGIESKKAKFEGFRIPKKKPEVLPPEGAEGSVGEDMGVEGERRRESDWKGNKIFNMEWRDWRKLQ